MQLEFENIQPEFLEPEKTGNSTIWDQHILIEKGEKVQVIASSGKGKTSLVHFLYGLRTDFSGNILFNNTNTKSFTPGQLSFYRREQVSIVFQDLRLFPEHSVYENLEIKRALKPYHPESKITEMATRLGIQHKLQQLCRKCSYGEQQRVAIIRALQQPFALLVLDEPFSNLDEVNRSKAMELISEEVHERNATMLFFDLRDIEYFKPDRILFL